MTNEEKFNLFVSELNNTDTDTFLNALKLIEDEEQLLYTIKQLPFFFQYFNITPDNKFKDDLIKTAFISIPSILETDSPLIKKIKKISFQYDYLLTLIPLYSQELFLDIRDELINQKKFNIYFSFLKFFSNDDFDFIFNNMKNNDYLGQQYWTFNSFIKKILQDVNVPYDQRKRFFNFIAKNGDIFNNFKRLNEETKNTFAKESLELSIFNYVYLSEENRIKYIDYIDFYKYPSLIKHHPDLSVFSVDDFLTFVKKDPISFLYIPNSFYKDSLFFTDDLIISLVSKLNNIKIIKTLNENAPERLTYDFCLKLKEQASFVFSSPIIKKIIKEYTKPEKDHKLFSYLNKQANLFYIKFNDIDINDHEKLNNCIILQLQNISRINRPVFWMLVSNFTNRQQQRFIINYLLK